MGANFSRNKTSGVITPLRVILSSLLAVHLLTSNAYSASEVEPNDSIASAQPIALSESVTGVISTSDDADIYAVYLSRPGRLTFEMRSAEYDAGGWLYEIFNPGGELLRGDYCEAWQCQGGGFTAATGISGAGTHYVRIRSALVDKFPVGEYTFRVIFSDDTRGVEFEPNDDTSLAQSVALGESITGAISGRADDDVFMIELAQPSALELSFKADEYQLAGWNYAIYDPQGLLIEWSSCSGSVCQRGVTLSAVSTRSGAHSILIQSGSTNGFPSGDYTFSLTASPVGPPTPAGLSASFDEFSDRISLSWNTATGADTYKLMRGTSESDITEVIYSGEAAGFVDFGVEAGTTYFYQVVAVNDRGQSGPSVAARGRARLDGVIGEVEPNGTAGSAQPIGISDRVTGIISGPEDRDVFAIEVNEAGQLTLSFETVEADNTGWLYGIYDPQRQLIHYGSCSGTTCQRGVTLSAGTASSGKHYIQIWSALQERSPEGAYTFSVSAISDIRGIELEPNDSLSSAQPISLSESIAGRITLSDDEDIFVIELAKPGELALSFGTTVDDDAGWHYEILDAEGTRLAEESCKRSTCPDISAETDNSGTHYIRIASASSNAAPAGDYLFSVSFSESASGPPTPSSLSASNFKFSDRIDITWDAVEGAKTYKLMRGTSSSTITQLVYTGANKQFVDFNVVPGTSYYYTVAAVDDRGESAPSASSIGAANGLAASWDSFPDRIRLTWSEPPGTTKYEVMRGTSEANVTTLVYSSDDYNKVQFDDFNVVPGTTYFYQVQAENIFDYTLTFSSVSGRASVSPPASVTDLSLVSVGTKSATFTFSIPADWDQKQLAIERYEARFVLGCTGQIDWVTANQATFVRSAISDDGTVSVEFAGLPADSDLSLALRVIFKEGISTDSSNVMQLRTKGVFGVTPTSVEVMLGEGESEETTLTLSNRADAAVTYSASITGGSAAGAAGGGSCTTQSALAPRLIHDPATDSPLYLDRYDSLIVQIKADPQAAPQQFSRRRPQDAARREVRERVEMLGGKLKNEYLETGLQTWKFEGMDSDQLGEVLSEIRAMPDVDYAEPDYVIRGLAIPNDPRFGELWGLRNLGSNGGTPDADIDAELAWDQTTGNRDVVVAVIDTGVDYLHPDLVGNIWSNSDEVAGNGIDDDGNGFVDDIRGYDFYAGDADPMDGHSHGTHCAGTIGAVGNNNYGVVGVAHSVSIMPVSIFGPSGRFAGTSNAIAAIYYAVDNGADILSNSWGGGGYSTLLKRAIEYARDRNVLFVAAAGNDGSNNDNAPHYPSSYDVENVISVAASDRRDEIPYWSNYGRQSVDLAAPGEDVLSTIPNERFGDKSGTSMATPHVAGAAALLSAYNRDLSALEIKNLLLSSVDSKTAYQGRTRSGGRLNVAAALARSKPVLATISRGESGTIAPSSDASISINLDGSAVDSGIYQSTVLINLDTQPGEPYRVPLTTLVGRAQVRGLAVTSTRADTSVSIVWNRQDGTDGYQIYRSSYRSVEQLIATTTDSKYIDNDAESDTRYFYRVRALYGGLEGDFSEIISGDWTKKRADLNLAIRVLPSEGQQKAVVSVSNPGPDGVERPTLSLKLPSIVGDYSVSGSVECQRFRSDSTCFLPPIPSEASVSIEVNLLDLSPGAGDLSASVVLGPEDPIDANFSNNTASVLISTSKRAEFIERLYTNILGRPSDAGGMEQWLNLIQTQSAATVARGFLGSAEFKQRNLSDSAFVDILYRTLFDREPDEGGRAFWVEELRRGKLREMAIYGFLRSAEFESVANSYGVIAFSAADQSAYGIRAFVERFYTLVLGRQPDEGGFQSWVANLSNGRYSGGDIAKAFFLSPEYLTQRTTDDDFVTTCYRAFFGREPDAAGKQGWLDALVSGTRESVLDGFINSAEFFALASSYGISATERSDLAAKTAKRVALKQSNPPQSPPADEAGSQETASEATLSPEEIVMGESGDQAASPTRAKDAEMIPVFPLPALMVLSALVLLLGLRWRLN